MMKKTTGYSRLQIALHWGVALLVGVNYLTGEAMIAAFDHKLETGVAAAGFQARTHIYVGTALLVLVGLRLAVRLMRGVPEADPQTPRHMARAGEMAHLGLYGLLALVPVLGLVAWFRGIDSVGELHVLVMNGLMVLAGLHAAAALFHHYVLKDGLIHRMLRAG